jgi:hypothetical protein
VSVAQVASELARACGAFSTAHSQLHHLCCVIADQLLDVAAIAPEVRRRLARELGWGWVGKVCCGREARRACPAAGSEGLRGPG